MSKALGLHVSSFYRWKTGSVPHERTIRQVADYLRIREAWLRDGEGEMNAPATANRIQEQILTAAAKEESEKDRLPESQAVFHSRRTPPSSQAATLNAHAAATKRSDVELIAVMRTALERIELEKEPLIKLGYIATARTILEEMERRLRE